MNLEKNYTTAICSFTLTVYAERAHTLQAKDAKTGMLI